MEFIVMGLAICGIAAGGFGAGWIARSCVADVQKIRAQQERAASRGDTLGHRDQLVKAVNAIATTFNQTFASTVDSQPGGRETIDGLNVWKGANVHISGDGQEFVQCGDSRYSPRDLNHFADAISHQMARLMSEADRLREQSRSWSDEALTEPRQVLFHKAQRTLDAAMNLGFKLGITTSPASLGSFGEPGHLMHAHCLCA